MFEHRADSYLLHYRFTEDAPTLPLGDYSEFDHVDIVDGSGASHTTGPSSPTHCHTPCTSDGSGINNVNAEDISILLPSTLGWECMARDSFLKIRDAYEGGPELPELRLEDLRVNTVILGATQVGQCNTQLPWIWSFGTTVDQDGTWMDEFNRVHWLRAKAQFQRWMKEQASLHCYAFTAYA
ncbi:hypothetical protein BJY52DRAFT_1229112 [Lactarius psammicola]|nr:hypothetical protein BJY52DRAFT_1229112 [Lactarius psammicola]